VQPWSYGGAGNARYVNVAERLRGAMQEQEHLRVFNAAGYYDLATPEAAADYMLDRDFAEPGLAERVTRKYYEAGHMMYVHAPSREQLRRDLKAFYEDAMTPASVR
jgi:carboxypeptidase C (cathepsin A)